MRIVRSVALMGGVLALAGASAEAAPYSVAHTAGGSWNTVYVQGFSTALGANPAPAASNGDPVYLNQFQFFKSGTADTAANVRLAILNNIFTDLDGLNTSSPNVVGLSGNTVASTAAIATGDPISFSFDSLPLSYGSDYAAVFVNVGGGGELTPVRVSALTANYQEVAPGDFRPASNYGAENQFQYATSNFINGDGFFSTFSWAGDANFAASLDTVVPEPASAAVIGGLALLGALPRRRRTR